MGLEGRNERGKEPRAASLCPGRGGVSPPHGSFCTLAVTGTHGHGCEGAGDPHPAAPVPCPCVSLPCGLSPGCPGPPQGAAGGLRPRQSPVRGAAPAPRHRQRARLGGTDSDSVLYSIQSCFLSGADICPGIKKDRKKKKKRGKKRQSSSSISGCGKILVSSSSQPEARPGLEVEGGLFPCQPRLPQGLPLSHSPFSSPAVMPRCG